MSGRVSNTSISVFLVSFFVVLVGVLSREGGGFLRLAGRVVTSVGVVQKCCGGLGVKYGSLVCRMVN